MINLWTSEIVKVPLFPVYTLNVAACQNRLRPFVTHTTDKFLRIDLRISAGEAPVEGSKSFFTSVARCA